VTGCPQECGHQPATGRSDTRVCWSRLVFAHSQRPERAENEISSSSPVLQSRRSGAPRQGRPRVQSLIVAQLVIDREKHKLQPVRNIQLRK
jgi:hypothetical protein